MLTFSPENVEGQGSLSVGAAASVLTSDPVFLEGILFLFLGVRCLAHHQVAVTPEGSSPLPGDIVQECIGTLPILLRPGWLSLLCSRSVVGQELPLVRCQPSLTLNPLS